MNKKTVKIITWVALITMTLGIVATIIAPLFYY